MFYLFFKTAFSRYLLLCLVSKASLSSALTLTDLFFLISPLSYSSETRRELSPKIRLQFRNYSKRVTDIPNVGFYSLPKKMGRTGRFINDGLRLISLGCKQKQKNTNTVQKPNTVLVAVCHFPPSPFLVPVGSSANKSLHRGYP